MQVVTPEFAKNFVCAAGACPDTCCQGWQVIIDPQTLEYYQHLDGELGEAVRAAIVPEKEPYFGFSENGYCALLSENGLCKLQFTFGEEAQCKVCRTYPRFVRQYGSLREEGVSLSCPEALRLLLEKSEPVQLITAKEAYPIEPNELDPELFFALKQGRTLAFQMIQDRRYCFSERLFLVLCFAEDLQYCLSGRRYKRFDRVQKRFSSPVGRLAVLRKKDALRYSCAERYRLISEWCLFFSGLEVLSPKWKTALDELLAFCSCAESNGFYREKRKQFDAAFLAEEYQYEHILFATLFKYWLEAADDGILLPKVQQAAVCLLMLRELNFMQWVKTGSYDMMENAHRIAREIEHNEENLEAMRQAFLHAEDFRIRKIKTVI